MERMLDLGADARLHLLRTLGQELVLDELVELSALAPTHGNVPGRPLGFSPLVHALVAGVTEGRMLFTMQQCTGDIDVTHVGCGAHHRMYEARLRVQTDVRLHSEVPLAGRGGR